METHKIIIEYLKVFISWPVMVVVALLIFRKSLPGMLERLTGRMTSAEIAGQKFEFSEDLSKQSEVSNIIEKVKEESPTIIENALNKAGIKPDELDDYILNIKSKVKKVQKALSKLGYDIGKWGEDGIAGSDTKEAVRKFQADNNLLPDGVIGKETLKKLEQKGLI